MVAKGRNVRRVRTLAGVMVVAVGVLVNAATVNEDQKLTASDAAALDRFGNSCAIEGDTAIVGAERENGRQGAAYVFVRDPNTGVWSEEDKLVASDGAPNDEFGHAVSISGNYAIIGAPKDGASTTGSAYLFRRVSGSWAQQARIEAADQQTGDRFGSSVSIYGGTALIGARFEDGVLDATPNSGAACLFSRTGSSWTQDQKVTASDAATGDLFGASVALQGRFATVGAEFGGGGTGAAYVYARSQFVLVEEQKLTASDAAAGDSFGFSMATAGDTVLIGAPNADIALEANAGAAYVFVRDDAMAVGSKWSEQQKLTHSDGVLNDAFGFSVGVWDNVAVVGVDKDDEPGASTQGSVRDFERDPFTGVWTERDKLEASDIAAADALGISAGVNQGICIAGAHRDGDTGDADEDSGSAYIFEGLDPALVAGPAGANGFIRPRVVRVSSRLVVHADLDLGDDMVDFAQASTIEYGTKTHAISGMTQKRRGQWNYRSANRNIKVRVRESRRDDSKARFTISVRSYSDSLPNGNEFQTGFELGTFDVESRVALTAGKYSRADGEEFVTPLTLVRAIAKITGTGKDTLSLQAEFMGDSITVPGAPPVVTLRLGDPTAPHEVRLSQGVHTAGSRSDGWDFRRWDPGGGLRAEGIWFCHINYETRIIRVFARDVDLGPFAGGAAQPFLVSIGFGGTENAIQVTAYKRGSKIRY